MVCVGRSLQCLPLHNMVDRTLHEVEAEGLPRARSEQHLQGLSPDDSPSPGRLCLLQGLQYPQITSAVQSGQVFHHTSLNVEHLLGSICNIPPWLTGLGPIGSRSSRNAECLHLSRSPMRYPLRHKNALRLTSRVPSHNSSMSNVFYEM